MGEGKRGKPGSELERLQIFAELATEYFRMVELFTARRRAGARRTPSRQSAGTGLSSSARPCCANSSFPDEHVSLKLVVRALRLCNYSADSRLAEGAAEAAGMFTNGMIRDREALMAEIALADGMTCSRTSSMDGSFTVTPTGSAGPDGPGTTPG